MAKQQNVYVWWVVFRVSISFDKTHIQKSAVCQKGFGFVLNSIEKKSRKEKFEIKFWKCQHRFKILKPIKKIRPKFYKIYLRKKSIKLLEYKREDMLVLNQIVDYWYQYFMRITLKRKGLYKSKIETVLFGLFFFFWLKCEISHVSSAD